MRRPHAPDLFVIVVIAMYTLTNRMRFKYLRFQLLCVSCDIQSDCFEQNPHPILKMIIINYL